MAQPRFASNDGIGNSLLARFHYYKCLSNESLLQATKDWLKIYKERILEETSSDEGKNRGVATTIKTEERMRG